MERRKILFDSIVFPGNKSKAFTMSYDDGTIHDRRLVEIMNRWGLRGTFNLNSAFFGKKESSPSPFGTIDTSKIEEWEVSELYAGHEIAGHGLAHASPTNVGSSTFMYETISDKANLERIAGKLVRGYAYPFGNYDRVSIDVLRLAGYHYSRTVGETAGFELPKDFMEWHSTCHHNHPRLMELAETFCSPDGPPFGRQLFYLWGHSYEFATQGTWELIERFCQYMGEHGEDIWFATNIEIYDYITAYRNLEYSADGNMIFNPSGLEVLLRRGDGVYSIAPLATVKLD